MCAPAVMAGVSIASAAVSIYGQKVQGDYEVKQARRNAALARAQSADALSRGSAEAGQIASEGAEIAGAAQAALGASGIESTSGSAGQIGGINAMATARDIEIAKANAAREAWGLGAEAQDWKQRARIVKRGTILGGVGTGLAGVGSAMGAFSKSE